MSRLNSVDFSRHKQLIVLRQKLEEEIKKKKNVSGVVYEDGLQASSTTSLRAGQPAGHPGPAQVLLGLDPLQGRAAPAQGESGR